jgi:hypothetical protein
MWAEGAVGILETRNEYEVLVRKLKEKRPPRRSVGMYNIKMNLKEIRRLRCELDWPQNRFQ